MVKGWRTRLRQLGARHELAPLALEQLERLLELLVDQPHAGTGVRDPVEAVHQHLADSLSALPVVGPLGSKRLVDIGSGAGFPGLPLAVALPGSSVDLLESGRRRAKITEGLVAGAGIASARVVAERAELWGAAEGREAYDVATARAVASLPVVVEYAAPMLQDSGRLIVWRGARDADEERAGDEAARQLGLSSATVHRVEPFSGAHSRHLHVFVKERPTPEQFPRRPGMAVKRPLP